MSIEKIAIHDLDPKEIFTWFEKISSIPRGSKKEQKISDYLLHYAKERGFEAVQDTHFNLLIRKPASLPHLADKAPVILQSHLDMVWNKDEESIFNFEKDPIKLIVDGEFLRADKTTLGADDGIGIAYSMALLDAEDIPHPPLELVFTVQEELGMGGATHFDASQLKGTSFINIDSEEESIFSGSCCGGMRVYMHLPTHTIPFSLFNDTNEYAFFSIEVSGLHGGHSGIEIDKERGNSNRLLGRILIDIAKKHTCYLADIDGGIASNAIPASSKALVCILSTDIGKIRDLLGEWEHILSNELYDSEAKAHCILKVKMTAALQRETVYTDATFEKVLIAMTLMPHGVETMDLLHVIPNTSRNFAMICVDGDKIVFTSTIRSMLLTKRSFIENQLRCIAQVIGAEVTVAGAYPPWKFDENSAIREVFFQAHRRVYGTEAEVRGIHAGLECGIFIAKFKELGRDVDMFAFGPTIIGAHTPTESLNILAVKRSWELLKEALKILSD